MMAVRPVYAVSSDRRLFERVNVNFVYYSGFADSQKKKSIQNLHEKFLEDYPDKKVLEISTGSAQELGVKLSAFNLMITGKKGTTFSVESAFQSSKVFENGGPYRDLLRVPSREAKKDPRIRNSGDLIGFQFNNTKYDTEPKTFFFNWLYINALNLHKDLAEEILDYDAFTDISFNPQKSLNCQAEAAAVYVSLVRHGLLEDAMKNREDFKRIVYPELTEDPDPAKGPDPAEDPNSAKKQDPAKEPDSLQEPVYKQLNLSDFFDQ